MKSTWAVEVLPLLLERRRKKRSEKKRWRKEVHHGEFHGTPEKRGEVYGHPYRSLLVRSPLQTLTHATGQSTSNGTEIDSSKRPLSLSRLCTITVLN